MIFPLDESGHVFSQIGHFFTTGNLLQQFLQLILNILYCLFHKVFIFFASRAPEAPILYPVIINKKSYRKKTKVVVIGFLKQFFSRNIW